MMPLSNCFVESCPIMSLNVIVDKLGKFDSFSVAKKRRRKEIGQVYDFKVFNKKKAILTFYTEGSQSRISNFRFQGAIN
jgi:hypothetical protein